MENSFVESRKNKRQFFVERLKVGIDKERQHLIDLQIKYENGIIKEEDMTLEQIDGIEKIYGEQIKKLKNDNNEYKNKLLNLKKN